MIPKISLFDSNFAHHGPNQSLASFPNYDRFPSLFEWTRDENDVQRICVFTDNELKQSVKYQDKKCVAWLLEPKELSSHPYEYVLNNLDDFDLVLSHDVDFLKRIGSKGRYYLYSGSWVSDEDFKIHKKTKMTSMIASWKRQLEGHQLRHVVISNCKNKYDIDVMGNGYRTIANVIEAYKDYRFTIVIENVNSGIISEKLISALLCGTVPIYCGNNRKVREYFDEIGIMFFNNMDDLNFILHKISLDGEQIYNILEKNIKNNFEKAKELYLTEDVIWKTCLKDL